MQGAEEGVAVKKLALVGDGAGGVGVEYCSDTRVLCSGEMLMTIAEARDTSSRSDIQYDLEYCTVQSMVSLCDSRYTVSLNLVIINIVSR